MKLKFRDTKLNARSMEHLNKINAIIEDYQDQGYKLTLRQLYYQLVSKNVIKNEVREYKKLSRVLTEGRMAGLVDWDAIEDNFAIKPIALTMEQIKKYNPPPNPAKITDTRSPEYIRKYGKVSWEVDALPPEVLDKVLTDSIEEHLDLTKYEKILSRERKEKKEIKLFIDRYDNEDDDEI